MFESKIFFRLTQASRKLAHDKKAFCITIKKRFITLNIYIDIIDINEFVYEGRLMMKVFSMTRFLH